MPWGRLDDGFDEHPKVEELLDGEDPVLALAAVGLWTLTWTWAHRNTRRKGKTPGLIPAVTLRRFAPRSHRGEIVGLLVKVGLWDEHPDGWLVHDFDQYLATEKTREQRAEAGRRGAAARWGKTPSASQQVATVESQTDGNLLSAEGKLPSVSHEAMANNGSRARPVPVPVPKTQNQRAEDQTLLPRTACAADDESDSPVRPGTDIEPAAATAAVTLKQRRGSRLPEGWVPSPATRDWQAREFPGVDVRIEHLKFTNYWLAKSGRDATKTDWDRTWQNWIMEAASRAGIRRGAPARMTTTDTGQNVHRKSAAHLDHLSAYGDDQ